MKENGENHNSIRAERVKEVYRREGLTQTKFAEVVKIPQQAVSEMIRGKRTVTEESARRIHDCFPQYRLQWLMGYDEYMTTEDVWAQIGEGMKRFSAQRQAFYQGVTLLASACGYAIDGNTVSHGGVSVTLSQAEREQLFNEIRDMAALRLSWLSKEWRPQP